MTKEEFEKMSQEELIKALQEQQRQQQEEQNRVHAKLHAAQQQAAHVQHEINTRPKRQYAAIVAVDLSGGFSKDGQIPWHYPADFKFFQSKTKGHVCVMGRTTYDDINTRLGDKAAESVLPGRVCYVVTSTPLPRNNATVIASLGDLDITLDRQDVAYDKTIFYCGGERIYNESISKCNTVYMTVVNKELECDKFFPTGRLAKSFSATNTESAEDTPDIKFVTWSRDS